MTDGMSHQITTVHTSIVTSVTLEDDGVHASHIISMDTPPGMPESLVIALRRAIADALVVVRDE